MTISTQKGISRSLPFSFYGVSHLNFLSDLLIRNPDGAAVRPFVRPLSVLSSRRLLISRKPLADTPPLLAFWGECN